MTRVVVLTRGLPLHHAGGMESVAWDLCRALGQQYDVTVVTTALTTALSGPDAPAGRDPRIDGVRVRGLAGTTPGRYSRAWWSASRAALAEELAAGPVAGVLSVSAGAFSGVDLAARAGVRTVLQAHGTSVMELSSKLTSRRVRPTLSSARNVHGLLRDVRTYRRFDEVVAIGPSVQESLQRAPLGSLVGMPPVHLVENGVDRSVFAPLDLRAGAPVLLVVGRLHPQKRVDRSIRLLTEFPGATLVLAGDGPDRGALEGLARDLGVSGRVRFLGSVDRSRVPDLYAGADVSLLTSQWREGLPMAVLESLACGTPVVTARSTAPVAGAGSAVLRVDASNPADLAGAVRTLLLRTPRTGSLLPERYDLANVAARYAALLGLT